MKNIKHIGWDFTGTLFRFIPEYEVKKQKLRLQIYSELVEKPLSNELENEYKQQLAEYKTPMLIFSSLGAEKSHYQKRLLEIDMFEFLINDPRINTLFQEFETIDVTHSLFTNWEMETVKSILSHIQIDLQVFKNILTIEDVQKSKPDLEGFKKVVDRSGISPHEILFVGDREEVDILPAKKVGMKTALVWSDKSTSSADWTFPHVADVLTIFR